MSRKTERLAKKVTKKVTHSTVEKKVKFDEESIHDEEIPDAVPIDEEEEDSEEEEQEQVNSEDDDNDDDDDDEESDEGEEGATPVTAARPIRAKINNEPAMIRITEEFKLKNLPWIETMSITSSKPIELENTEDEMKREMAFYQQALEAAKLGRDLIKNSGDEFSRPDDYFAEMIKSDEHMAKVRQRLLDESASVKASEEAKRQRQLKKFGKKVQVEKQLERQKQKTETLEKIKLLKRKRKDGEDLTLNDDFDIALEKADTSKRAKTDNKPTKSMKRINKDSKYGSGGKKRHAKSNTAESSAGLGGFNKMKGKPLFMGKGKKSFKK